MLFLASMGKTGLTHDIFFKISVGPFEVIEAKGGRLVKEADFEAEKNYGKQSWKAELFFIVKIFFQPQN